MSTSPFVRFPDLHTVTFTGVDERTDLAALRMLQVSFPPGAVEWGVLYSESRAGQDPRYPSLSWVDRWAFTESQGLTTALHLCGESAQAWIAGDDDLRCLARGFSRLQLNVRGDRTDAVALRAALDEGIHPQVITQHHSGNAALTAALAGAPHHAVLFDTSGGRGQRPEAWPAPLPTVACGYAGGLGPATVAAAAMAIAQLSVGRPYWLDMEQALRTADDRFDLERVAQVLAQLTA